MTKHERLISFRQHLLKMDSTLTLFSEHVNTIFYQHIYTHTLALEKLLNTYATL